MRFITAIALLACLAGCATELKLKRAGTIDANSAEPQKPYAGIPYPLMFTTFEIEVTHRLVSCKDDQFKVASSVEITSQLTAPDMSNMFLIDPSSLSGPFKAGEVKLTYLPNGAIASLNAKADDKAVAVASNVIGGIIKIASIGIGAAGANATGKEGAKTCPKAIVEALAAMEKAEPAQELATKAVATQVAKLERLTKKLATMGSNADAKTRGEYGATLDSLLAEQAALKKATATVAKLLQQLAIVKHVRWPKDSSDRNGTITVSLAESSKWGEPESGDVRTNLTVGVMLEPAYEAPAGWQRQPQNYVVDPTQGLPFRLPQPGLLKVCHGSCAAAGAEVYTQQQASILQLGDVYYMPCRSPAFTSASCDLSYAESGELKTMGAARTTATAEQLSAAFKDATGQYGDYRKARSDAEAKAQGAELADLKAQAELAAAKAALVKDPNADVLSQTASIKAAVGLYEAKAALLAAQAALAAAQQQGQP